MWSRSPWSTLRSRDSEGGSGGAIAVLASRCFFPPSNICWPCSCCRICGLGDEQPYRIGIKPDRSVGRCGKAAMEAVAV